MKNASKWSDSESQGKISSVHTKEVQILRNKSVCEECQEIHPEVAETPGGRNEDQQGGRMTLWERTNENKSMYKNVRMKAITLYANFKNNSGDYDSNKKKSIEADTVLKQ